MHSPSTAPSCPQRCPQLGFTAWAWFFLPPGRNSGETELVFQAFSDNKVILSEKESRYVIKNQVKATEAKVSISLCPGLDLHIQPLLSVLSLPSRSCPALTGEEAAGGTGARRGEAEERRAEREISCLTKTDATWHAPSSRLMDTADTPS